VKLIKGNGIEVPDWVSHYRGDMYYLPSHRYIISLATLRAKIYLTTGDKIDIVCPPERKCFSKGLIWEARRVVNGVFGILRESLSRFVKEGPEVKWNKEIIDRALSEVGRLIDSFKPEPRDCRLLPAIACYVGGSSPTIYVAIDRLENLAREIEGKIDIDWDSYYKEELKRMLLKHFIIHEITHSFIDACCDGCPAKSINDEFTRRVIEESLATFIAFKHFELNKGINEVFKHWIISEETLEYSVFWVWNHLERLINVNVNEVLRLWAGLGVENNAYLVWIMSSVGHLIPVVPPPPFFRHFFSFIHWLERFSMKYPSLWKALTQIMRLIDELCRDSRRLWKLLALCIASYGLGRV